MEALIESLPSRIEFIELHPDLALFSVQQVRRATPFNTINGSNVWEGTGKGDLLILAVGRLKGWSGVW